MNKIWLQKRFRTPLLLILAGVFVITVGNIFFEKEETIKREEPVIVPGTDNVIPLEEEIRQLICSISGVKDACVVITYQDSGEQLVEKDVTMQSDKTHEEDGTGGNRVVEGVQQQEETVYVQDQQGNKYPFVRKESYGTVQGVAVVVRGDYHDGTREKIIRMLEVLLNVPTHKIQVLW